MTDVFKYRISTVCILMLCVYHLNAQVSLERQVIGSTGNSVISTTSNISLSYTVGEAVVNTFESNPYFLTQGFHQPDGMLLSALSYTESQQNTICPDVKLGSIKVEEIAGCLTPYVVRLRQFINGSYVTQDSITNKDSSSVVEFKNLGVDTFIVQVIGATFCVKSDTIILEAKNPEGCAMKVYSGITPNNDGANDAWIIDNIEIYGENEVSIFNRWGNEIWSRENYDNETVVWRGENKNGTNVPDATYFYVIKTESETVNGWVEVTR